MSGRRPPRPRLPRESKGFADDAVLSEEEVQRRVDVRGGAATTPPAPIEPRARDRRPVAARRPERRAGRASLLLIGLAVVGIAAIVILLPDGPLGARSSSAPTAAPTAQPTAAALVPSAAPATATPNGSPSLITLPPGPEPTVPPVTTRPATPAPAPATPRPVATPRVTPKPTATPKPTPKVTAAPTTATLLVQLDVLNGDGGTASAADWTVTVTSSGPASPTSFTGSAAGTLVTLKAGSSYAVAASGPAGYSEVRSSNCSSSTGGTPIGGASETCTIQANDQKPTIIVFTNVDNTGGGTLTPSDFTVTVTGTDVTPSTTFAGKASGVNVRVDAGTAYSIDQSGGGGAYTSSGGTAGCSGSGLALDDTVSCTFTFTYVPPGPTGDAGAPLFALHMPLAIAWLAVVGLGGRRRWTTLPTR